MGSAVAGELANGPIDIADKSDDLTGEMLRCVHTKLDDIQDEMRLRFTGLEAGLSAIEHRVAAAPAQVPSRTDELLDLRRRIERRLELTVRP